VSTSNKEETKHINKTQQGNLYHLENGDNKIQITQIKDIKK
jgi:hypothetical protein